MATAALSLNATESFAQTATTLRFGSHAPAPSAMVKDGLAVMLKNIERDAGGSLKIEDYWGGALIKAPDKQYEALLNGIQQATMVFPAYTEALFPDFSLFNLPFLFKSGEEATTVAWKMHEAGLLRGLEKVKLLSIFCSPPAGMFLARRETAISAVHGKRIQGGGPTEAKIIEAMGGAAVAMSVAQAPEALSQRLIDGCQTSWTGIASFKVIRLLKTFIDMPLGQSVYFAAISKEFYDSLPEAARAGIDKNSGLQESLRMATVLHEEADRSKQQARTTAGAVVIKPEATSQEYKDLETKFRVFHTDWIGKTPDGQKKFDTALQLLGRS